MENLKRFGGTIGVLMALIGAGVVWFMPDRKPWGWGVLALGSLLVLAGAFLNGDEFRNVLRGRPFRYGANAVFYALIVLGIVVGVNLIAARHNKRFDLTPQGANSLSPQTVQILEGLDQDVAVVAFFRRDQGPRQKEMDLLDEYKERSRKLTVRVMDPYRNPAEVKAYGVEFDGTVIVSAKNGQARVTPNFQTSLNEQELTNAIIKAISSDKKVVCVSTGHGEKGIEETDASGIQIMAEALRKENFEVRSVRLLEAGALDTCNSLVVPGATHTLLPPEVDAVQAYASAGGRVLVLTDPQATSGLEPMLEAYGLKVGNDFVVDINPMSRLAGGSPAMPVIYDYGTHPITRDFQGLITIFRIVESIETVPPTEAGATTEMLARTTDQAWGETGDMAERVSFDQGSDKQGPLTVAAASSRKLESAGGAAADANGAASQAKETRIVLFGDSDFASNEGLGMGGNRDLLLNTIAWLNERSDLISIRPKPTTGQPLILTGRQGRVVYFYSLALFPILLGVAGFGVYLRRRRL
ncbi:MAG: GldG family protein [Candidatus Polarisedimenticolia bacterium]